MGGHSGGEDVEADWHRRFAADRLHGEWFRVSPELAKAVGAEMRPAAVSGEPPVQPARMDRDELAERLSREYPHVAPRLVGVPAGWAAERT